MVREAPDKSLSYGELGLKAYWSPTARRRRICRWDYSAFPALHLGCAVVAVATAVALR